MSYINKPLEAINLSDRTLNALVKKNNIQTTNDLWSIRHYFEEPSISKIKFKGIWNKGIKEIINAINIIKDDFNENKENIPEIENKANDDIEDFSNEKFYIPMKINRTNWSYNQRQERKKNLNEYLSSIYKWTSVFSLEFFINKFLETLSNTEISILKNRLLFLENNYIISLSEIAKNHWITHERVRQIEDELLKKIREVFTWFGETEIGKVFKKKLLDDNRIKDYWILDFSNNKKDFINWTFLSFINTAIVWLEYEYFFLNKEHKFWEIALIYKKILLEKNILNKFFSNIDKIYKEKRPEEKSYIKDVFISKITKPYLKLYLSNPAYEYCILKYLWNIYNIFQINWTFIFPQNKKDLKFLVKKELEALEEPIHFKKMFETVVEKYPEYKRNFWKVHNALMTYWKNVWNGLYVKSDHNMKWWTIWDIAEEYLKNKWWVIKYSELLEYILENKIVKKWSIESVLFEQDKQRRFVRIDWKQVWLKEWNPSNIVKSRKTYKIDEEIYEFLKDNKITEFTANEIIEKLWKSLSYQRAIFALNKLIEKWKISFITRGITNYYYVL